MPILDFNKRTQSCRSLVLNDNMGFCSGDQLPWEEWKNVPYGSRYFRLNGDEWKKVSNSDGPEGWELAVTFTEDVGKEFFDQTIHGFIQANHPIPVYIGSDGRLLPAIATSRDTLSQLFIKNVVNIDRLEVHSGSNIIYFPNHDLVVGKTYYTSNLIPGGITDVPPSNFVNPLYTAVSPDRILVYNRGIVPSPATSLDRPACKVTNSKTCVNLLSQSWTMLRDMDTFDINDNGSYTMPYAGCIRIPSDGRYSIEFQPHVYAPHHKKQPEYCIVVSGFYTGLRSVSSPISGVLQLAEGNLLYIASRTADKKGNLKLRDEHTSSLYIQQLR